MSYSISLNRRQQHVLWATIRHYIATAEPVGSKALVEEFNLDVSPATIRNAMGYLEKAGLLYQPHTSAGRVPSDSGYRIYVDQLITPADALARKVEQLLGDRLQGVNWSFEAILRGATQILSTLSGYITLITLPQTSAARLRHLQLVQIDPDRVMLLVVLDSYETLSTLVDLPSLETPNTADREMIEQELHLLSNFLNSSLQGKTLAELSGMDWQALDREFQSYGDFLKTVLVDLIRRAQPPIPTQIVVSGVSEVLRHPEFSELQQIQAILHLLEDEQDQLWPLICEWSEVDTIGKRVTVRIGSENPLEPMRTCALVSATYKRGGTPVGSVGILGPTRMMYENAIATVEAAADYLSEALG
ncbi:MAG: heat-inducible transcriptional repressor HrcA [Leptolyngbyaceae cyanobacterium bins.59]|nr:heat-inducible transcriptional repressor HrcA [Leptolyngbyaceae cyanobacterium bins.59]